MNDEEKLERDEKLEKVKEDEENWTDNQPAMEGFFDYKNFMVNPAAGGKFHEINRDLQLGNLNKEDYKIVFGHLHLAMECARFSVLKQAADYLFQRGYTHLVMSNSRDGRLRTLEATSIRRHEMSDNNEKTKERWMKWR
jgi:hypothetical protein